MEHGHSATTTNHGAIKEWVKVRKGYPARVKPIRGEDDPKMLAVGFEDTSNDSYMERIGWKQFFTQFEETRQAFLYQEITSNGTVSRFFKFVTRSSD